MHDPPFLTACHAVYTHACMVIELIEVRSLDLLQLDTHIPDHRCIMHMQLYRVISVIWDGYITHPRTTLVLFSIYSHSFSWFFKRGVCVQPTKAGACMYTCFSSSMHACMACSTYSQPFAANPRREEEHVVVEPCLPRHSPPRSINIYIRGHLSSDASQLLHNKLMPMGLFLS